MKSFFQKKLTILLLAAIALGALTVLATSLNDVPFKEAQQFARPDRSDATPMSLDEVVGIWEGIPLWQHVVLWGLIGLLVVLLAMLLSPELRKRFIIMLFRTLIVMLAVFYILGNYGDKLLMLQFGPQLAGEQAGAANAQPLPEFQAPEVSPTVSYLISFAVALGLTVFAWVVYRGWKKYVASNANQPLVELGRIARSSLKDLNSGRDSTDVIINCYLRMSDVVADKRQLHRELAMTPQEFALRLERAGLPGDAVRRLTRLFEMVRYGDRKSAPKDVNEAVSCLNTILHYCGENA